MLSPEKLCGRGEASDLMGCHEEGHFMNAASCPKKMMSVPNASGGQFH